jgi:dTDP-4-amino-4,6-dideoxygalactose transaminase
MAGQACKMKEIQALAKKYNLKIIEDAAHSLPSTSNGQMIGTIGDITVFSFYATKTITTGEGGMIVTNNPDYKKRMEIMRLHGFSRAAWDRYNSTKASWHYEIVAPGYKYNLTDIASSLGLHQLKKCDQFFEKRVAMANIYNEAFKNHPEISTPVVQNPNDKHSFHLYIIKVPEQKRNQFIDRMKELGVGCSVHFIPLHFHPYWRDKYQLKETDFPIATKVFKSVVSLPLYTKMTAMDQQKVIKAALEAIK